MRTRHLEPQTARAVFPTAVPSFRSCKGPRADACAFSVTTGWRLCVSAGIICDFVSGMALLHVIETVINKNTYSGDDDGYH